MEHLGLDHTALFKMDGLPRGILLQLAQNSSSNPVRSNHNLLVEEGQWIEKGDEIPNFYFGGSDIVLVFEEKASIQFVVDVDTHYRVGERPAVSKAA